MGLLDALGIDTEESEMSFALSMDSGALEWGSHRLGTIFAQRENLWKLSYWQMIWDVVKFGRQAPQVNSVGVTISDIWQSNRRMVSFHDVCKGQQLVFFNFLLEKYHLSAWFESEAESALQQSCQSPALYSAS